MTSVYAPEILATLPDHQLRDLPMLITNPEDLAEIAQALPASGYDPSLKAYDSILSKNQQETLANALLRRVNNGVPPGVEAAIMDGVREAMDGYWTGFQGFCQVIVSHSAALNLNRMVQPLLRRAIFCHTLLREFARVHSRPPQGWLDEIHRRRANLDFVELYPDLADALPGLDKALANFG